ncbi:MAG: carboxypeptidase regulatory-like domain-containing protein [Vicinamibacterales bacterium]
MRPSLAVASCLVVSLGSTLLAQAPPAAPPARTAPPAGAQRTAPAARAARPLDLTVTDPKGMPLADVRIRTTGPVDREGVTDDQGTLRLLNLRAGTYRLRFDAEGFVSFEREVAIAATGRIAPLDIMLTPEPPAPAPPPPPEPVRVESKETPRPTGEARTLQVPDFWELNPLGRSEPQKASLMGCTGFATTRLLQVREPMTGRVNPEADETLYVVAGEASITLGGGERQLEAGGLAVIPRGTTHTLSRRGRNPVVFVSVLSGPVCESAAIH